MSFLQKPRWTTCQTVWRMLASTQQVAFNGTTNSTPDIKPFKDIPGPKGLYAIPKIGSIFFYKPFTNVTALTFHRSLLQMFDKYGPIFTCNMGNNLVFVSDPRDIETVFQNEGKYPARPVPSLPLVYAKRNNIKLNLVQLDGEDWFALRSPLNKRLMKADSAHHYLQVQNVVADELVHILKTRDMQPEEISDLFFRYAAESIGTVCFNARLGFLGTGNRSKDSTTFLAASLNTILCMQRNVTGESVFHTWYRNKTYKLYEKEKYVIQDIIYKYINAASDDVEEKKRNGTLDPNEPNLLLSLMGDSSLVKEDIFSMLEALYAAGTDSTAKNLQTFMYNLAINPDKQEILREEVTRVMGNNQMVTSEALANMPYLKASLKESFRMKFPIATGTWRILPNDIVLSGYKIPAKTNVAMYNLRSCLDYFSNPNEFLPERWMRSAGNSGQQKTHRCAMLPFGFGTRSCIGRRFAEQEIYLSAVKVLQNFKIELEPESYKTKFVYKLFITPEEALKFRFTPISN